MPTYQDKMNYWSQKDPYAPPRFLPKKSPQLTEEEVEEWKLQVTLLPALSLAPVS